MSAFEKNMEEFLYTLGKIGYQDPKGIEMFQVALHTTILSTNFSIKTYQFNKAFGKADDRDIEKNISTLNEYDSTLQKLVGFAQNYLNENDSKKLGNLRDKLEEASDTIEQLHKTLKR